jgi:GrpB-like predicted nucleotidyltransferase (UPF0157 family)
MSKKLSEMTLEELWQLFPIFLTQPNGKWSEQYRVESAMLIKILPPNSEIHHIGSTAINGIWAKPIIDILIEIDENYDLASCAQKICGRGYIIMSETSSRISLNKGYTENGFAEKVFHIHLQHKSEKDEVLFRDYLNAHPDIAKEYENLKLKLWKKHEHNRDAYTEAKTDFIKKYTAIAKSFQNNKF